jgi:hypothetical protein
MNARNVHRPIAVEVAGASVDAPSFSVQILFPPNGPGEFLDQSGRIDNAEGRHAPGAQMRQLAQDPRSLSMTRPMPGRRILTATGLPDQRVAR